MRNRRQTIWLVSMLGLMVVLSAYYLLTDDVKEMDFAASEFAAEEIALDTIEKSDELTLEELTGESFWLNEHGEPAALAEEGQPITDEQILQQIEARATSGQDFFAAMQLQRMESMDKESDRLLKIITDSSQNSVSMNQAFEEMQLLEDELTRMTSIEEQLLDDFSQVFIERESKQWKIYVQSDNLQKSQAVSILDLVMNELDVPANQIVVQRVP